MSRGHSFVFTALLSSAVFAVPASFAAEAGPSAMPPSETAPAAPAVPPGTPLPPWMSPEVIKAAVEINMDPPQQQAFRQIVGDYITKSNAMVQQELRRESVDKERTIKRKNNALLKKMDQQAKELLREDQWPKYLDYKNVLLGKLSGG